MVATEHMMTAFVESDVLTGATRQASVLK